ncbi:MAG: response regulator transcription factor [Culicoidibacterales bacterium]
MELAQARILVVDDDLAIARAVALLLEKEGYAISVANDGAEALALLENNVIDLIILDVMMPKLDGLSTAMKIRQTRHIPIIMLSAKTEASDKILGLSIGADDYMTKPFDGRELVARVNSQLRRYREFSQNSVKSDSLVIGGLSLNPERRAFSVDGVDVYLTVTEFNILQLLMENPNIVFSTEKIYERVWQESGFATENAVMVHIRRIREKIEINPKEPKYLKVVWGVGYKIERNS